MSQLPGYIYAIFICLLASLLAYSPQNRRFGYLKLFAPYLVLSIIVEIIGSQLAMKGLNNTIYYTLFTAFEFCFYLYITRCMINSKKIKAGILLVIICFPVIALVNLFYFQGMVLFNTVTYSLGCILVVVASIIFFLQLFRNPGYVSILRYPPFWICCGILFYYSCSFPLFGLMNYWSGFPIVLNNFDYIVLILNSFLYAIFTIAFLWIKPHHRKSTSSLS